MVYRGIMQCRPGRSWGRCVAAWGCVLERLCVRTNGFILAEYFVW